MVEATAVAEVVSRSWAERLRGAAPARRPPRRRGFLPQEVAGKQVIAVEYFEEGATDSSHRAREDP
jgi:hypothetical protein